MSSGLTYKVQLIHSTVSLGEHNLEVDPLPGTEIILNEQSYLVMERRNRYHLKAHRYELRQILLLVKCIYQVQEKSWHKGQWIIGDVTCQFNARSPLIRCVVNPDGPCNTCHYFQAVTHDD